jgi:hypothetical protein
MRGQLQPDDAADLDLVVSYDEPYWPDGEGSLRDNARLGPLRNASGMWLTGTSYRRQQQRFPTPEGLSLPLPQTREDANRMPSGGPIQEESGSIFWYVESITSREFIEASNAAAEE